MKSLEIVNEMLNYPFEERILTELATNETIIREEELETIKQDLEVLEILRNHLVFMGEHKTSLKLVNNGCVSNDLVKVKQWLEENE
jgi:hypothetical protein